jgi:hypothetical protein
MKIFNALSFFLLIFAPLIEIIDQNFEKPNLMAVLNYL